MLENIKKIDKNKVLFYLEMIFYIYCFVKMCLNLCYGAESMYQTFRDCYNYRGIAYFLVVLLMVRRAKIWHPGSIIYSILYAIGSFLYFKKNHFEIELFNANLSKCIAFGLFFLLIIDFIVSRNIVKWSERNKVLTIIFAMAFLISVILSPGRASLIYLVCPFAALYFIRITKAKWMQLMNCLSIAIWFGNIWVMVKSLLQVPYEGGRYWGVFLNLSTMGIFCAAAATSAFYWFITVKGRDCFSIVLKILSVVAFGISFFFIMLISARVAQLSIIIVVIFGLIVWFDVSRDKKSNKVKNRMFMVGGIAIIALVLFVLALWGLYNVELEDIENNISNVFLREQLSYWHDRAGTTFDAESANFKHGSLLAMLDRFSSGRLGVWVKYLKDLTLQGYPGVYSYSTGYLHPHNNYVAWLYQYGLIGGSIFLLWFVSLILSVVKKSYKTGNKKYIFPSLCCFLAAGAMLPETILWIYLPAFLLLFVQYIFIIDIPDDSDNDVDKKEEKILNQEE